MFPIPKKLIRGDILVFLVENEQTYLSRKSIEVLEKGQAEQE